jgi:hypothetical protein
MTLYLNKPTYLHNSVSSSFSNLTKALEHHNEHQNESDAKTIDNYGSSLENHTFDSLTKLIDKSTEFNFIIKKGGDGDGDGDRDGGRDEDGALTVLPRTTNKTIVSGTAAGGGGRVKRTRNLRNKGNNKSQKKRKRKHLNYTKK